MHVEMTLLAGWVAVPVFAYIGGSWAIGVARRKPGHPPAAAEDRLEELRLRMEEGRRTPRGRMAEAVWLAESASPASPLRVGQQ